MISLDSLVYSLQNKHSLKGCSEVKMELGIDGCWTVHLKYFKPEQGSSGAVTFKVRTDKDTKVMKAVHTVFKQYEAWKIHNDFYTE